MMATEISLTDASLKLLIDCAKDAANWNGQPLLQITKQERGNLTQLKKAGLLTTFKDEGHEFVIFTAAGKSFAASHGVEL